MFHISVGLLMTCLGFAFGAGLVVAEPLMRYYAKLVIRRRQAHAKP